MELLRPQEPACYRCRRPRIEEVEPFTLDALLLADELRRAAEESVAPCPCGRTLANMRDYSDICDFNEEPTG